MEACAVYPGSTCDMKAIFAVLLLVLVPMSLIADDLAVCAVCGPREGAGFEPVKARATHQGHEYAFCSLKCKIEFLKNPNQFLVTDFGKPAPPFALRTLDGKPVALADFAGRVVLLDFWGTFCIPCVKALPELQALHEKYGPQGFSVVGLNVDERLAMVKKAVKNVTYPQLQATPAVWNAWKINGLPSMVLVGRDGRIIRRYGAEADKPAMIAEIEKALAAR
jgi:thiol-disulfide isomerase/thioredoxin